MIAARISSTPTPSAATPSAATQSAAAASSAAASRHYYDYDPSSAAAITFTALFAITTLFHVFQMAMTRAWFMIPFCLAGLFELVGYAARAVNAHQTPDWEFGPYVMQTLLILLGPPLLAATIYMEFGRIINLIDGAPKSLVKPRWLTGIFVFGDVVSFLVQCGGGVMLTRDDPDDIQTGQDIVLVGLYIQIVFFGFFILNALLFHYRMSRTPTVLSANLPWKRHYVTLFVGSVLILIRSIYRVIEYVQGREGELMTHEVYLYCLDAFVMFLAMIIFHVIHPSAISAMLNGGKKIMLFRTTHIEACSADTLAHQDQGVPLKHRSENSNASV